MTYIYIYPILIILQSYSDERGVTSYNSMKGDMDLKRLTTYALVYQQKYKIIKRKKVHPEKSLKYCFRLYTNSANSYCDPKRSNVRIIILIITCLIFVDGGIKGASLSNGKCIFYCSAELRVKRIIIQIISKYI